MYTYIILVYKLLTLLCDKLLQCCSIPIELISEFTDNDHEAENSVCNMVKVYAARQLVLVHDIVIDCV